MPGMTEPVEDLEEWLVDLTRLLQHVDVNVEAAGRAMLLEHEDRLDEIEDWMRLRQGVTHE